MQYHYQNLFRYLENDYDLENIPLITESDLSPGLNTDEDIFP